MNLYGAVELGGTKTLVTTGNSGGEIADPLRLETGDDPEAVVASAVEFLSRHNVAAIGIASFGPLELRRDHPDFGTILATPKSGWAGYNLVAGIGDRLDLPVAVETDVNGAAIAEGRWGAAAGLEDHVYVTVGTGIGAGVVIGGDLVHGLSHPEFGHIAVEPHPEEEFEGVCPYHGSCLEGMASGPALEARFGARASRLEEVSRRRAVALAGFYLAQAIRTLIYTLSPQRVVVGGGVSRLEGLHAEVRAILEGQLGGYGALPEHAVADFVVAPGLGDLSGLVGGIALAADLAG